MGWTGIDITSHCGSQMGTNFAPPGNPGQRLETFLAVTACGVGAARDHGWPLEDRVPGCREHLAVQRADPPTKNYPARDVSSTEAEKHSYKDGGAGTKCTDGQFIGEHFMLGQF